MKVKEHWEARRNGADNLRISEPWPNVLIPVVFTRTLMLSFASKRGFHSSILMIQLLVLGEKDQKVSLIRVQLEEIKRSGYLDRFKLLRLVVAFLPHCIHIYHKIPS